MPLVFELDKSPVSNEDVQKKIKFLENIISDYRKGLRFSKARDFASTTTRVLVAMTIVGMILIDQNYFANPLIHIIRLSIDHTPSLFGMMLSVLTISLILPRSSTIKGYLSHASEELSSLQPISEEGRKAAENIVSSLSDDCPEIKQYIKELDRPLLKVEYEALQDKLIEMGVSRQAKLISEARHFLPMTGR